MRHLMKLLRAMNNSFATVGMLADSAESMMQEGINAVNVGGKKHNEEVSEDDMDVLIDDTNLKEATNQVEEREEVKKEENSDLREEVQALKLQNEEMNKNFKAIMEMMKSMGMATNAFAGSSSPEETESEDEVAVTSEAEVHQEYAEETATHEVSASERKVSPVVETSSVPVEENKHEESEVLDEDDPLAGDITFGDEDTEVPLFDMDDEEEEDDSDEDFLSGLLQGQVMSV